MKRKVRRVCAALASLVPMITAQAAICTVSTTSVAFGAYNPLAGVSGDSTGTISVVCDMLVNYSIGINTGMAGTFSRTMGSGTVRLAYNLFTDASRSVVWGDGSAGTGRLVVSGTAGSTHPVYGRIPSGQNVPAGSYADSLIVTVEF